MADIELAKEARARSVASIQQYFEQNFEPIGNLPAGHLLDFFLAEIGPAVYNQAIADAQARIVSRAGDLAGELFADEFQYWPRQAARRRSHSG